MWDVKSNLIQVEIGEGLVQRYSSRGFWGSSNDDGKLLLDIISDMRERLQKENIIVPTIRCRDDSSLGREEFVVYAGAEFYKSNIQKNEIADVIEFFLRRYQLESPSKDIIHECICAANEHISQQRYADGLRYLNTAYYWSDLLQDCEEEEADIILQIGRILLQNQDMQHALLCAQRADFIVSQPSFYNPYLKCASEEFFGSLCMLNKDFQTADQAYFSAFSRIVNVAEANLLKIGVLSADLQALQLCADYVKANQVTEILIDVLAQSGSTDLLPLYILKSYIANCAINQLREENAQLRKEVQLVNEKYNEALNQMRFRVQLKDAAITMTKWTVCNLPVLTGSLMTETGKEPRTKIINNSIGTNNKTVVAVNNYK